LLKIEFILIFPILLTDEEDWFSFLNDHSDANLFQPKATKDFPLFNKLS